MKAHRSSFLSVVMIVAAVCTSTVILFRVTVIMRGIWKFACSLKMFPTAYKFLYMSYLVTFGSFDFFLIPPIHHRQPTATCRDVYTGVWMAQWVQH
ncbi:hypothetical protein C8J55DRAFT_314803 [Lentinula edodes]|uniref:Uncharacterized protein n=1 Tax=Lentinula lateritia TaxID=40482 RepID=A0A9W9DVX6_9AGAR|nr:hypothetical protein C8J55DRAFT_314803 [Lentinula edodes]